MAKAWAASLAAVDGRARGFAATYLQVHARLVHQTVNGLSLLYEWGGKGRRKAPIVLVGRLDVVPVLPPSAKDWAQLPYAGAIRDGFVCGRSALDNNSRVIAVPEAVEELLRERFEPTRTVCQSRGGGPLDRGGAEPAECVSSRRAENRLQPLHCCRPGGRVERRQRVGTCPTFSRVRRR
jgi:hypothetical protein